MRFNFIKQCNAALLVSLCFISCGIIEQEEVSPINDLVASIIHSNPESIIIYKYDETQLTIDDVEIISMIVSDIGSCIYEPVEADDYVEGMYSVDIQTADEIYSLGIGVLTIAYDGQQYKTTGDSSLQEVCSTIKDIYEASSVDIDYKLIDDTSNSIVMDRVLNEYDFTPMDWSNTIEWEKDADILVKMAEDSTGRYQAWGIISKESGAYGIVLNDTIDGTDRNTNYVHVKWFYTGNSELEPSFSWENDELYFTYPAPIKEADGYLTQKVKIDCGYDTGHMEFAY